ncbi:MAG: hypothetical protein ED559_10795 [Phycisphaera sp.]|nr:MAG: hypothetical protein ED559_10795 [Phycisphaera sp.]
MSNAFDIRPSFTLEHAAEPEELATHIMGVASADASGVFAQRAGRHVTISPVISDRHLWSPWLHVEVEERNSGSLVRAKYSPHPNLWTSFAFGYLTLGALVFFAGFFALAQTLIGQGAWAWWVTIASLAGMLVMWITAKVGQQLAHDQMIELRQTLDSILASPLAPEGGDGSIS